MQVNCYSCDTCGGVMITPLAIKDEQPRCCTLVREQPNSDVVRCQGTVAWRGTLEINPL